MSTSRWDDVISSCYLMLTLLNKNKFPLSIEEEELISDCNSSVNMKIDFYVMKHLKETMTLIEIS